MTHEKERTSTDATTRQDETKGFASFDNAKLHDLINMLHDASIKGEVSTLLARRAIGAFQLALQDARKHAVRSAYPVGRQLNQLSDNEIAQLRFLNRRLVEIEAWIREQAERCLRDYYRAGGLKKHRYSREMMDDVEIEVEVACILRKDHPDFDKNDDNAVAKLDWIFPNESESNRHAANWNEFLLHSDHKLNGDHHCWLFHDLYEHRLRHDWDKVLSIGEIRGEVRLVQRRILSFA